jgi:hypothetical protein
LSSVSDYFTSYLNFSLYPNPSKYFINVSFSSPLSEDALLISIDLMGKRQFRVFIPRQTAKKEIDISELSSGIYFLTLETRTGSVTKKLVKN